MQIADYIAIIRRRWWVILLTAFVAAASGYAFSKIAFRMGALYRTEATYLVVANQLDLGLANVLTNNMNSYRLLALAPTELDKISQQLKLDRSADWLLDGHIAVQAQPDVQTMVVQATYPDPAVAQQLADAVGDNMMAVVAAQNASLDGSSRINLRKIQAARPAWLYWPPRGSLTAVAGAVLGLFLGLLLAFILEAFDNSLKSSADVERFVGLTTLGSIPTVD